jgi:secretion/DNA translocation related TadE-like protein
VGLAGLVLLTAAGGTARGVAVAARHRAELAADLAALAAAARALDGSSVACAVAGEIARANGARLTACRVAGQVAEVNAEVGLRVGRLGPFQVRSLSRAGPAASR